MTQGQSWFQKGYVGFEFMDVNADSDPSYFEKLVLGIYHYTIDTKASATL